jgi:hypothetical protein
MMATVIEEGSYTIATANNASKGDSIETST